MKKFMEKFVEIITKMTIEIIMLFFFTLIITIIIGGVFNIGNDLAYFSSLLALPLFSFLCFLVTCLSENEIIRSMRRRFLIYSLSSLLSLIILISTGSVEASFIFFSLTFLFCFIVTRFSKNETIRIISENGEGFLVLILCFLFAFLMSHFK